MRCTLEHECATECGAQNIYKFMYMCLCVTRIYFCKWETPEINAKKYILRQQPVQKKKFSCKCNKKRILKLQTWNFILFENVDNKNNHTNWKHIFFCFKFRLVFYECCWKFRIGLGASATYNVHVLKCLIQLDLYSVHFYFYITTQLYCCLKLDKLANSFSAYRVPLKLLQALTHTHKPKHTCT